MKKAVIFDLDGTLLDTSAGIIYCYRKSGEVLGLGKVRVQNEMCVIGGPLARGFETLYGKLDDDKREQAVSTYKKFYGERGIKKFASYDGVEQTLKALKDDGFLLAVATLKLQKYAVTILKSAGLAEYFDAILGWDGKNTCSKSAILISALQSVSCAPEDAVLAGDSEYDEIGAKEVGVDFIGVSYGFGIDKTSAAQKDYAVAQSPREIYDIISVL